MPKVNKKLVISKDIEVIFDDCIYSVKIFKHHSPAEIYREIHKALPPIVPHFRITDASNALLQLRYEDLKATRIIYAHRAEHREQGPGSQGKGGVKSAKLLTKVRELWEVKDGETILPSDLRPRVRPLGKDTFATKADVTMGIDFMDTGDWPAAFVTALYQLSKVTTTKGGHDMAISMLHGVVAERHADKDEQHHKVYEAMTADVRKAAKTRAVQLEELAAEGYGVALFAGGLGEALVGVEEEEEKKKGKEKAKEVEEEKESAPHSFMMAYRPKKEQGDEWL